MTARAAALRSSFPVRSSLRPLSIAHTIWAALSALAIPRPRQERRTASISWVADPGGPIHPAEPTVPDHLAVLNGDERGLGYVRRTLKVAGCELCEKAGTHGSVAVVGDVGHRLADRLPDASCEFRMVSESGDHDAFRDVDRGAWAAVEEQSERARSAYDDKAVMLGERHSAGVVLETEGLEFGLAERACVLGHLLVDGRPDALSSRFGKDGVERERPDNLSNPCRGLGVGRARNDSDHAANVGRFEICVK